MRVFNGLMREEMQKRNARFLSDNMRPTQVQAFNDGSFVKLITCPVCRTKNLPMHNALDVTWGQRCLSCGAAFAFHEKGVNPGDALRKAGKAGRDRHPLLKERAYGKGTYIDGQKLAEWDLERRYAGRRANSLGLNLSRSG